VPRIPLFPKHPERTCWGCDLYCPADDLRCGNGTIRTPHPVELFGDDWLATESAERPATFGGPVPLRVRHPIDPDDPAVEADDGGA
jgi:hypothetical protein